METNLYDNHKVNIPKLVFSKVKFRTATLIFSVTFLSCKWQAIEEETCHALIRNPEIQGKYKAYLNYQQERMKGFSF